MPEACQGSRGCLSGLGPTAKRFSLQCEAAALFICVTNSFAREVLLQDFVFLLEIVDDHVLLAIHQAGKTHQNHVPRLKYCVHTVQISCILVDLERSTDSEKLYLKGFSGRLHIWMGRHPEGIPTTAD